MKDLGLYSLSPESTIREAIARIDRNAHGIVLVVDEERSLLGTVTDGDIRRKILEGVDLDTTVTVLLEKPEISTYARPVTVPEGASHQEMMDLMRAKSIRHLPVVDGKNKVVDLIMLDDLLPVDPLPMKAVIMAGGTGSRLHPLTETTPKPLLPVGERPLLEHTVDQLRRAGIHHLSISTHFQSEKIKEHFGTGEQYGVTINYISENQPLGTAGALGLMEEMAEPFLVINGDILTKVDYRAMHSFHNEHGAELTIGVKKYEMDVPFGEVQSSGALVTGIHEKPRKSLFINAGIYLLEPGVQKWISKGQRYEMTNLIQLLIKKKRTVVCFPIVEYWLDIGLPETYEKAQKDIEEMT